MEEKNRNILKKAVAQLPQYGMTKGEIWAGITRSLEKKEEILSDLPEYKTPDLLWERLAGDLDEKMPVKVNPDKNNRSLALKIAAAAAILILAGLGIRLLTGKENPQEEMSYTIENVMHPDQTEPEMDERTQHEINILLNRQCKANPLICASLEYKDLQNELLEIDKACEELKQQIVKLPDSQLYQFLYRMENERISVQKELLQLFHKS